MVESKGKVEGSMKSLGISLLGGKVGEIVVEVLGGRVGEIVVVGNISIQSACGYGNTISGKGSIRGVG